MQKGHKGGKPKTPVYLGLFAIDSKDTTKCIRAACKNAILCVLQKQRPQAYLEQGQQTIKKEKKYELETDPMQDEVVLVEKDYSNYENFNCPGDNYHCTTLYIGHKLQKLNKQQKNLFQNWKSGQKMTITIDFLVYVPNHIIAGFVSNTQGVEVDNDFPHITLLLKGKASAVESNSVLELLNKHCPEIFKERLQKVTILNIAYANVSRVIYVIDQKIEINAVSGDNFQFGKK